MWASWPKLGHDTLSFLLTQQSCGVGRLGFGDRTEAVGHCRAFPRLTLGLLSLPFRRYIENDTGSHPEKRELPRKSHKALNYLWAVTAAGGAGFHRPIEIEIHQNKLILCYLFF